MTPLCALATYAALAALALAMGRHHQRVFAPPLAAAQRRSRRLAGWSLLLLSLLLTLWSEGAELGAIVWCCDLTVAGLVLALLLTFRPRAWFLPLPVLGLLAVGLAFFGR